MLFGKREANNSDGQDDPVHQVGDCNFPAKEDDLDHVEDDIAHAVGVFIISNIPAKGSKGSNADLDRLNPEGDAYKGKAEGDPTDNVAQSS